MQMRMGTHVGGSLDRGWCRHGGAACCRPPCVLWWQGGRVKRLDARVAQLSAALALLTDTVEAGFQDVLRQTAPVVEKRPAAAPRANTRRRIRSAAKRGRPRRSDRRQPSICRRARCA